MVLKKLVDWLTNPLVIVILVILFFIIYIVYLETSHELTGKFWEFGPVLDDNGKYYKYMTFTLDKWSKVITVYAIVFITSFITTLYNTYYKEKFIHLTEKSDNKLTKYTTYFILVINPLVDIISYIVNFFAVACFQIQYLLPLFIGSYAGELPFIAKALMSLSEKKIL